MRKFQNVEGVALQILKKKGPSIIGAPGPDSSEEKECYNDESKE